MFIREQISLWPAVFSFGASREESTAIPRDHRTEYSGHFWLSGRVHILEGNLFSSLGGPCNTTPDPYLFSICMRMFLRVCLQDGDFCGIGKQGASQVALVVKNPPANAGPERLGFDPWVGEIPWRRAWQPTPAFLPRDSPWTEEPGGLQAVGSQRVGHDWVTKHSGSREWPWTLRSWACRRRGTYISW